MIVNTSITGAAIVTMLDGPDRFVVTAAHHRSGDLASCVYPGAPDDLSFFDAHGVVVLHMRATPDSGTGLATSPAFAAGSIHAYYWDGAPERDEAHAAVVALVDAGEIAARRLGQVA